MRAFAASMMLALSGGAACQCDGVEQVIEGMESVRNGPFYHELRAFISYNDLVDTIPGELIPVLGKPDGRDRVIFDGEGVLVTISQTLFDSTRHTITWHTGDQRYACGIDGKRFWGTDGDLPREELADLSVIIDGENVTIPRDASSDLYNPNLWSLHGKQRELHIYPQVARSKDRKRVYVHMTNSDGAGGYDVVWIFLQGKYQRRVVDMP